MIHVLADLGDESLIHGCIMAVLDDCPLFDKFTDARGLAPVALESSLG
jgi:hypothetical protein